MRALILALLLVSFPANASPVARFEAGEVSITLHDDLCSLDKEITNLKRRAVWVEKGKSTEGCWGISAQFGFVMMYFADKTATALPAQVFEKMTST